MGKVTILYKISVIPIFFILLMVFPISTNTLSDTTSEWDERHCCSVTKFEGDIQNKTMTFLTPGNDITLGLSLPDDSKIKSASIDIEGRSIQKEAFLILNYTDTVRNKAWDDEKNQEYPPSSPPSKFKKTAFISADYDQVKSFDGNVKSTLSGGSFSGYPIQLYEFNMSTYTVLGFVAYWVGTYIDWNGMNSDGMNVSIWNVTGSSWDIIGGLRKSWGDTSTDKTNISKLYNNPSDYIDATSKNLYVLVYGPQGAGFSWVDIATDYISINITQDPLPSYPENPYLNIGNDDDKEWIYTGELSTRITITVSELIDELQEHVDTGTSAGGFIYIPFEFGTEKSGQLYILNLSIGYVINNKPTRILEIPSITFDEDSGWVVIVINITNYFQDIDDPFSDLTYKLNGESSNIWGSITHDYKLKFNSANNYFGKTEFNISCRDLGFDGIQNSDDNIEFSNNFTVEVEPSDDPPVIERINSINIIDNFAYFNVKEDTYANFTIFADDIDGDDIEYSINITDSAIEIIENKISFLPENDHVGIFNFTIFATEMNISKLYDFVNVSLFVENTNDGPIIGYIYDWYLVDEDSWLNFTITANDPDLLVDNNEKIKLRTNFSSFGIDNKLWDFDENTGNFSFLPNNSHVGIYHVNFTVEDNFKENDWINTIIEVRNIIDPPVAKQISYIIIDADKTTNELENLSVNFTTETAYDPDIIHGDKLTYSWDFDSSDGISSDATGRNVVWTYFGSGNYTITLTVSDSGIPVLADSETISIQVLKPKEQEEDDNGEHDNGIPAIDRDTKEDKTDWIIIAYILIILIIVIVVIVGFVLMRQRRLEPEVRLDEVQTEKSASDEGYPIITDTTQVSIPTAPPAIQQAYKPSTEPLLNNIQTLGIPVQTVQPALTEQVQTEQLPPQETAGSSKFNNSEIDTPALPKDLQEQHNENK